MSKTNNLIRLAARLEIKLAQQNAAEAAKKLAAGIASYLDKVINSLSKNGELASSQAFTALKGVKSNLEQWSSLDQITQNEYYNVSNLWNSARALSQLDENSINWVDQQIQTIFDYLSPAW